MRSVLVPCDGSSPSHHAVRHVIQECMQHPPLHIHLLNVQAPFSQLVSDYTSDAGRREFHQEHAQAALSQACQMLDAAQLPYTVHTEVGDKVECIVQAAQQLQCDGIVMGTSRKSALLRLLEHSVTSQVMEHARVPVEIVAAEPASRLERVGIPAGVGTGAGLLALWMVAS